MAAIADRVREVLRLTLTPGLGPVKIARLIEAFGSPAGVLGASASMLERVRGIGKATGSMIAAGMEASAAIMEREVAEAERLGVSFALFDDPEFPPLLRLIEGCPPVLSYRGVLAGATQDRYAVGVVGSRACSAYGLEQAERFAGVMARSGLTVVSGGARGIDSAAHRGALRAGGRTVVVSGCGLAEVYPPENTELFDRVIAQGGAVVSELPLRTPPTAENFPARNRIVSGMSLGVLVIEAGLKSGALITARLAAEEHGREVFAVPGRVDSPASRGTHELIKMGGATLVTDPGDVIRALEAAARHCHGGTFEARYAGPGDPDLGGALFEPPAAPASRADPGSIEPDPVKSAVLDALREPMSADRLVETLGLEAGKVRAALTMLEIERRVLKRGATFERRGP